MIYWLNFNYVVGIQVKHLFLILSIFLLTSPLFCQETGVLYQYKISSGFVWKTFGKGKVQPKYKGEISNGTPEGLGVLSYPFTDGKRVVGEWKDGKEWNTEHYKKDGKVIGKWVNGKWILKWGVLCGTLEEGTMVWFEKCYDGVESKYVGDIENRKPNGQGTYIFHDGRKYVGGWKDGKEHGQGTFTFSDGKKGVGEFRENKPWNITTYDKDGNIRWKMVNGVKVEPKVEPKPEPKPEHKPEHKPVEVEETVEVQKPAEVQKAVEEKEAEVVIAQQQEEVVKEEAQIAVEQDAEKSVEAPKAVTIISAPPEEPDEAIYDLEMVYFAYDKSIITTAFGEALQKNYEWIAENPDVQIQLEGHCDERGTNEYNLALGERRAKAVFDYLISLGASPSQFSLVSFGEERPADQGSNEVAWRKNRRVEFTRL